MTPEQRAAFDMFNKRVEIPNDFWPQEDDLEKVAKRAAWIKFVRGIKQELTLSRGHTRADRNAMRVAIACAQFDVDVDAAIKKTAKYVPERERSVYCTYLRYHFPKRI